MPNTGFGLPVAQSDHGMIELGEGVPVSKNPLW
jgi:hypothetical protein